MPRLKQIVTPQQRRERAVKMALERSKVERDLDTDAELADVLGWSRSRLSRAKQSSLGSLSFEDAADMARRLQWTAEEWCAIAGVPFKVVSPM